MVRPFIFVLLILGSFLAAQTAPFLPDPASEGWTGESYAEKAQTRLKELLEKWGSSANFPSGQGPWDLLGDAKHTVPTKSAPQLLGGFFTKSAPHTSFQTAWADLAKLAPKSATWKWKVKTVAVVPSEQKTTHLVTLLAAGADSTMELHAEWACCWAKDGDKLTSLTPTAATLVKSNQKAPWFVDQTAFLLTTCQQAREQFSHGNAHWQLRVPAWAGFFKFGHHGGCVADVNNDGLEDLYVCQDAGLPNRLFLHQPDHQLQDVSAAWGLDLLDATQTALFIDLDQDGDLDAVLATSGPLLFYEQTAQKFELKLRLPKVANVYSLAASDIDLDGDLDIYAGRYFAGAEEGGSLAVPTPAFDANNGGQNFLIRNDGRAQGWINFTDSTAELGLDENNRRFTYASVWEDVNKDGRPDLYVANDYGRNNLYVQQLSPAGKWMFRDVATSMGLTSGAFGMSASTADINADGWPDLHLGAMYSSAGNRVTTQEKFRAQTSELAQSEFQRMAQGNRLFLNAAETKFTDISATAGIAMGRWSWGSVFSDLQNDGLPDLLVGNGFVTGGVPDDL